MKFPFETVLDSLVETDELAYKLAGIFNSGDLIVINGDLGSGKTTLIKNICYYYAIDNVTSPSFSIVNEYCGEKNVFHFDFYRIKNINELYDIGFDDYINDSDAIIFIEWGYSIKEIIPPDHYSIDLKMLEADKRYIKIEKNISGK